MLGDLRILCYNIHRCGGLTFPVQDSVGDAEPSLLGRLVPVRGAGGHLPGHGGAQDGHAGDLVMLQGRVFDSPPYIRVNFKKN